MEHIVYLLLFQRYLNIFSGNLFLEIYLNFFFLYFFKVLPGLSAAKTGQVFVGDLIVEVNGMSLEGKTHEGKRKKLSFKLFY